jgi:hypothetical protein
MPYTNRKLLSAAPEEFTGQHAWDRTFYAWLTVEERARDGKLLKWYTKYYTVTITVTDAMTQEYSELASFVSAEPTPVGLAQALLDQHSPLYHAGQVEFLDTTAGVIGVGNLLNISNSRASYASMNAIVQAVDITVFESWCHYSVTVGVPAHLGVGTLYELTRQRRTRIEVPLYERVEGKRIGGKMKSKQRRVVHNSASIAQQTGKLVCRSKLPVSGG